MMPPVRHLFWDFDGTLYNSYPQITRAFTQALNELGLGGLFCETQLLARLRCPSIIPRANAPKKRSLSLRKSWKYSTGITPRKAYSRPMRGWKAAFAPCMRQAFAIICIPTVICAPLSNSKGTDYGLFSPTPLPGRMVLPISPPPTRCWP